MALAANAIEEIRQAFNTFDVDGSESISSSEIGNVLNKLGFDSNSQDVKETMESFDRNNDGSVTFAEFANTVSNRFYVKRSHSEIAEKIRRYDADNSGYLSRDEVAAAMKSFRGNYSVDEVNKLVRQVDVNGDGKVSVLEFLELLAKTANN